MEGGGYFTDSLLNENSFMPFEDLTSPPEEQQLPTANTIPTARPNQKRGHNFTDKEDEVLVSAWLNVSTDPVVGTNQSRGTYWKRIYDFFMENKTFPSNRSQNSLMHRWSTIQDSVNKFCGCLSRIEGRRQSGVTLQEQMAQSCALFTAEDKHHKTFAFMHCWRMLRLQPKWHDKMKILVEQQASNKRQKTSPTSNMSAETVINVESSPADEAENCSYDKEVRKRPIGRKKAIEVKRRGGDEACMKALDLLWSKKKEADDDKEMKKDERYKQSYELEKKKATDRAREGYSCTSKSCS